MLSSVNRSCATRNRYHSTSRPTTRPIPLSASRRNCLRSKWRGEKWNGTPELKYSSHSTQPTPGAHGSTRNVAGSGTIVRFGEPVISARPMPPPPVNDGNGRGGQAERAGVRCREGAADARNGLAACRIATFRTCASMTAGQIGHRCFTAGAQPQEVAQKLYDTPKAVLEQGKRAIRPQRLWGRGLFAGTLLACDLQ